MNNKNLETIKELIEEIVTSANFDDSKLKDLDKSIDPNSYSRTVHLALALKELIYGKNWRK